MIYETLAPLLQAINIAVFERRRDGSFARVTAPPPWFWRLAQETFPFLGHILEEAHQFWESGESGSREWGPCVDTDEAGREFHYKVMAVTVEGKAYLLFQLDPDSDRLREVLQKVREQSLGAEQQGGRTRALLGRAVRQSGDDIRDLLAQLLATGLTGAQIDLLKSLTTGCNELIDSATKLADGRHR
jgi:hypothetical protein